ncbi:peptidyl-prolyl cis-trans isomerase CYP37, chloroplastic isoform X2 [Phoenix dactylifera]|uniref:Peptidyl-prolyl cis-trans isomerase CYP37, chloroplastic isoform X2 n=1 Tax=Phoenix dactylifera TaxID=42345 RepID=A0A8B9ACP0_PHODC|nr:peptidyl-prolyl cis-trans isomerase CYP37, chloroplastic isoform X2 [Phoenix dactylifera]
MAAAPLAFAYYHVSLSSDASALPPLRKKRPAPHVPSPLLWQPTDRKRAARVRISAAASSKNRSSPRFYRYKKLIARNHMIRLQHHVSAISQESSDPCRIPTSSVFSWLYHGLKGHECAIAAMLIFAQISFPLSMSNWSPWLASTANAVLYSPDTKVPRTGELALRRAIPANANMKAIQESLEDISYLLRIPQRKPYGTMEGDVKKAIKIATEEQESILGSIPKEFKEKGSMLYASLLDGKGGLQNLIEFIKEKDPDKVSLGLSLSLDTVAELELLQAPGLSFLLPEQYLKYPRLTGRGTVEFTIERGDGSTFFPTAGGEPKSLATVQVLDGGYDGVRLKCTNQAILSDNEPERYGYSVPLEVMPSGQFEPLYKTTLSVQDGELPVLPLSVYGAIAMAHSVDSDEYSSPSQFFFYLYDKRNAGLGGLSFDEGQFSVFGYTTAGREVLSQIKTGDLIRSAKLVQGQDRLILPDAN